MFSSQKICVKSPSPPLSCPYCFLQPLLRLFSPTLSKNKRTHWKSYWASLLSYKTLHQIAKLRILQNPPVCSTRCIFIKNWSLSCFLTIPTLIKLAEKGSQKKLLSQTCLLRNSFWMIWEYVVSQVQIYLALLLTQIRLVLILHLQAVVIVWQFMVMILRGEG